MFTLALAAAALSGALMAVQGTLNAGLGKVLGLLELLWFMWWGSVWWGVLLAGLGQRLQRGSEGMVYVSRGLPVWPSCFSCPCHR